MLNKAEAATKKSVYSLAEGYKCYSWCIFLYRSLYYDELI